MHHSNFTFVFKTFLWALMRWEQRLPIVKLKLLVRENINFRKRVFSMMYSPLKVCNQNEWICIAFWSLKMLFSLRVGTFLQILDKMFKYCIRLRETEAHFLVCSLVNLNISKVNLGKPRNLLLSRLWMESCKFKHLLSKYKLFRVINI